MSQLSKKIIENESDLCQIVGIPFSAEQLSAIMAPLEPQVIIAGAGSGKTTVMAARVIWLVGSRQVDVGQILGLTFTKKAAAELGVKIRNNLNKIGIGIELDDIQNEIGATYDSFTGKLLAEHGMRIGIDTDARLLVDATKFRLASQIVTSVKDNFNSLNKLQPSAIVERMLHLESELQSHLVTTDQVREQGTQFLKDLAVAPLYRGKVYKAIDDAKQVTEQRLELLDLIDAYQELKRRLGYLEFADQLEQAVRLVKQVPAVSKKLREDFKLVLLDEYQDTSSAQAKLLQKLFSGPDAHNGRGHPVTAVGDPLQAIYGWRGAAANNILQFVKDFPKVDGDEANKYHLSVSRRCKPNILQAANFIAKDLRNKHGKHEIPKLVAPEDHQGGTVQVASFTTVDQEVEWVCNEILKIHANEADPKWSKTAVLTRQNADIPIFYRNLSDLGVPVEIVGLGGLLKLPEIMAITATLKLIDDSAANPELVSLLTSPRWQIGYEDLALLGYRAQELSRANLNQDKQTLSEELAEIAAGIDPVEQASLLEALENPGDLGYSTEALDRFSRLSAELKILRSHASDSIVELVKLIINDLQLEVELALHHNDAKLQLDRFMEIVVNYAAQESDASLSGLLAYFDAEIKYGIGLERATPSESESVKLLTVHKAKGLEWEQVFLPKLSATIFPNIKVKNNWVKSSGVIPASLRGDRDSLAQLVEVSRNGMEAYNEELRLEQLLLEDRLAYVAVTRAKELLVCSTHYWEPRKSNAIMPSSYFELIAEVSQNLSPDSASGIAVEADLPEHQEVNPIFGLPVSWPQPLDEVAQSVRKEAAQWVTYAKKKLSEVQDLKDPQLSLEDQQLVATWDEDMEILTQELKQPAKKLILPKSISASQMIKFHKDPDSLAQDLLRPMPKVMSKQANLGIRFHEWVQQKFATEPLLDTQEPSYFDDNADLNRLKKSFERSEISKRTPLEVEVPFVFHLGEHVIRGRIDAVYTSENNNFDFLLVDWKTSNRSSDPLQLAIYRHAWADAMQIAPQRVDACFYHVLAGEFERPENILSKDELTKLLKLNTQ